MVPIADDLFIATICCDCVKHIIKMWVVEEFNYLGGL